MSDILAELPAAMNHFFEIFDTKAIDDMQPSGPATVYTPSIVVWLMIYQRLHNNATLQNAVDELLRISRERPEMFPTNRRLEEGTLSSSTAAFCGARKRLTIEVAESFADTVFDSLMAATPPSWQGRRVMIVDGTTMTLNSDDRLRQQFPPASNQHGQSVWPVMHLAVATELAGGCAMRPEIGAMYGPNAIGEVALAKRLLTRIPANSVLMADRNFGIFAFCYEAARSGHDTLTRLTKSRFESLRNKAVRVSPGLWRLTWKPTPKERREHPEWTKETSLTVMLHERDLIRPNGQTAKLYLQTTLPNANGDQLAALYKLRQDVETDIRDLKTALKMDELKSRTERMPEKEIALGMVALNLVVQIRRLAAKRAGIRPRRLSFARIFSLVTRVLLSPQKRTLPEYEELFEQVLNWAGQRKIPNRPNRTYDRSSLPKRRKHPKRSPKSEADVTK